MLPAIRKENSPEKKSAFARALERFAAHQQECRRRARIGFLIDATGSRTDTWENAQVIQAKMFRAASQVRALSLRLMYFGGGKLSDHGWAESPRDVAAAMARVRCQTGLTQILPGLRAFADEAPESRAAAIILIGDCFEEDLSEAERIGLALRQKGIRLFCFLEGNDWTAESAFRRLAELTGGRFARLGDELPLGALCEGVALLTAGGAKAVKQLPNSRAKQLLLTSPTRK